MLIKFLRIKQSLTKEQKRQLKKIRNEYSKETIKSMSNALKYQNALNKIIEFKKKKKRVFPIFLNPIMTYKVNKAFHLAT